MVVIVKTRLTLNRVNGCIAIYCILCVGIAVSLTSGALWMAAFIPIQLFPVLLVSPLRTHGTLSIIAALTMFSFVFTLIALPETKVV